MAFVVHNDVANLKGQFPAVCTRNCILVSISKPSLSLSLDDKHSKVFSWYDSAYFEYVNVQQYVVSVAMCVYGFQEK